MEQEMIRQETEGLPSEDEVELNITPTWDTYRLLSLKNKKSLKLSVAGRTSDHFCII